MLTQKIDLDFNTDSDDLHRSWFSPLVWIQENSAYTEHEIMIHQKKKYTKDSSTEVPVKVIVLFLV